MVQDESDAPSQPASGRGTRLTHNLLLGGIAVACALGVGLGLWARPGELERPSAARPQTPPPARSGDRRLSVVVDDAPAPVGKPLEVLAPSAAQPAILPPASQEPVAPSRPASGLVRVAAPAPGPIGSVAPRQASPPPELPAAVALKPPRPKPPPAASPGTAADKAVVRPARKAGGDPRPMARRETVRPERRKAQAPETAAAPPAAKPRHGFAALSHALARLSPRKARAEQTDAPRARRDHDRPGRARQAHLAKAAPRPIPKPAPKALRPPPPPKAAGVVRVANGPPVRCASPDPGEALACGDPGLGAAERRLARAYREAEVAGVPSATLQQQQQRWRAARAAAAREAPWAVREVYLARIAELQDQARDARGN